MKKMKIEKIIIIIAAVAMVSLLGYQIMKSFEQEAQAEVAIPKVSLINVADYYNNESTVSAIGEVEASQQVDLKSEISAQVKNIYVDIGDSVYNGQVLVEIDHGVLDSQVSQSKASLDRMKSSLDQMLAGATDEEIKSSEVSVQQAEVGLEQAELQLEKVKTLADASIEQAESNLKTAENNLQFNLEETQSDIIVNSYDDLLNNIDTSVTTLISVMQESDKIIGVDNYLYNDNFEEYLSQQNHQAIIDAENSYEKTKIDVDYAYEYSIGLTSSSKNQDIEYGAEITIDALEAVQLHLADLQKVLDATVAVGDLTKPMLDQFKSTTNSSQTQVSTSLKNSTDALQDVRFSETNYDSYKLAYDKAKEDLENTIEQTQLDISEAEKAVDSAKNSLEQAKASHEIVTADPRDVDIAGLQAQIKEAEAVYQMNLENQAKAYIRAPFNGTVSIMDLNVGQLLSPGNDAVSLVNDSAIQVKSYINYADRALIDLGSEVTIENKYAGSVAMISPSIDPNTKKVEVIISINDKAEELVIGQYVNAEINVKQEFIGKDVFFIPLQALYVTEEHSFVFSVDQNNKIIDHQVVSAEVIGEVVEVTHGLNPEMQILSSVRGLKPGDEVEIIN